MLTVRYPGRVCLLGEHCDWAGGASVAAPLGMGIRIDAEPGHGDVRMSTTLGDAHLDQRWPLAGIVDPTGGPLRFVGAAVHALAARGISAPPTRLWVQSDLPAGRGFSSSAAFCLATLDALARTSGHTLPAEELAELAFHVENQLLGVACGRLDPLACVAGTPVFLQWRKGRAPLRRLILRGEVVLLVAAMGAPRDTPAILAALARHHSGDIRAPDQAEGVHAVRVALAAFGTAAERGAHALETHDLAALGQAMNACQTAYVDHLARFLPELAAPKTAALCRSLLAEGALGAKFSGAGGEGSVVALFRDRLTASAALDSVRAAGLGAWLTVLGRP